MSTTVATSTVAAGSALTRISYLPIAFVILWSSGYIGGAFGVRYAEPFTMTFARFSIAAMAFLAVALSIGAPWPKSWKLYAHAAVVGLLLQVLQFGGLYSGIRNGVPAGEAALIVGMMPIFVILGAARFLGERITWRDLPGSLLGVGGVAIVVANHVGTQHAAASSYLCVFLALVGITTGSIYQKKFLTGINLWVGCFVQMVVAASVMLVLAETTETMRVTEVWPFAASVAWIAFMNSVGALAILYEMIRRGETSKATNLFHVIPATTQIMASAVLEEIPTPTAILGFLISASGIYVMNSARRK